MGIVVSATIITAIWSHWREC